MRKYCMSKDELEDALGKVVYAPHSDLHRGNLHLSEDCFTTPDRYCNVVILPTARIDCTANVTIGPWCMIGWDTKILTHDHYHIGRDKPLLLLQEERGVFWSDLVIGSDVWLHGCTILSQVTYIPDGVVVGANAVLTKNPGPYEIWAGNPARKVGERKPELEGTFNDL